jgi:hypothetical protein
MFVTCESTSGRYNKASISDIRKDDFEVEMTGEKAYEFFSSCPVRLAPGARVGWDTSTGTACSNPFRGELRIKLARS